jgi:hypothetical protein
MILPNFINNAIDSKQFSFKDNTFVAEASDFTGRVIERQIYDDACDIGIAIRSSSTGKIMKFFLHQIKKDGEGDVMFWEYHICADDARVPGCKDLKVIIFND